MIRIEPNTKVFISAPANIATGGPELLHQLGNTLNKLGVNTFMYYFYRSNSYPVHPEYEIYGVPFVDKIEDEKHNILIVPEVYDGTKVLDNYKAIQKTIWWLSIDNFYFSYFMAFFPVRVINKISRLLGLGNIINSTNSSNISKKCNFVKDVLEKNIHFHLVQSYYAKNFLITKRVNGESIAYLSDYLNDDFLTYDYRKDIRLKENIVVYNPNKGYGFTKKIMECNSDIKFVPIQNMSRKQVVELLKKAKTYIDFGEHPGKDRIPREAAICGCCIITGKKGSAAFFQDVSIPDNFKFEDEEKNIPKIGKTIRILLDRYEDVTKEFDLYRDLIKLEKNQFINDVKNIFCGKQ